MIFVCPLPCPPLASLHHRTAPHEAGEGPGHRTLHPGSCSGGDRARGCRRDPDLNSLNRSGREVGLKYRSMDSRYHVRLAPLSSLVEDEVHELIKTSGQLSQVRKNKDKLLGIFI